jgi:hypothetical protein
MYAKNKKFHLPMFNGCIQQPIGGQLYFPTWFGVGLAMNKAAAAAKEHSGK